MGDDSDQYDSEGLLEFTNGIDMRYQTHIIRIAAKENHCYGTDFATTASVFYFFIFGVELQHSAVTGSQLLFTLPSLAANSFLPARLTAGKLTL